MTASASSSPPLTDLALASLSLVDVEFDSTNKSLYSSKGVQQSNHQQARSDTNLLFTCNPNALVGAGGSRPLAASCLSRTLSNRSTSSNASSVNSNRSVRFTEDKPQVRYTYPKHVYDRAPIRVDERLALKRCRNEEEPRKWVEYLIDDFNGTDALSKYDDYDWSIPGEDKVSYPSVAQLSQLPPLPPSPLDVVKTAVSSKSQVQLDLFKMSSSGSSGSDSDSDGSSEGCDIYRSVLCDQSPTSTPATSPASSPLSNVLPTGSFACDSGDCDESKACPSLMATPTRCAPSTSSNTSIVVLPLFSLSYASPARSIPSTSSPNFARWDGMYTSSLPTSFCSPSSALSTDFNASIKELQGVCPGGNVEKKRLRMERLKLLRERCSAQEDSFECLGGF